MQTQNKQAFGSVSNHLDKNHLLNYGLHRIVPEAMTALEVLTKKHRVHVDMFEYSDDMLKFDVFRGRFPYLKYLASRAGEILRLNRKPCNGYCYSGTYYHKITKPQDIVDAAENAISGKREYASGIEGL